MTDIPIEVTVNGARFRRTVAGRLSLADFLREELRLTGTHLGCEHGVCGACSVLVDGRSVRACLMLAAQADGREVTTVEGLGEQARPLRECLARRHGLQCGFCTPGFLITATELLQDNESGKPLTEEGVREAISGNICRCTGYQGIVEAVLEVGNETETRDDT
ncbi:(2Fe-2S)-binding protein [Sciscionella sediminilitoris]|uniref:(2Fe-2S)-binding protein n=1 Tax=Sciscionella sediminilitoris TaxID=1445613 RepID=UPI00055A08B7|nr:(2Fe-2S)-binding protein [Sciscionella sp. SE31]